MLGNNKGGSGSVMGAPTTSLDRSSVLVTPIMLIVPFPIPSTITQLSNKCVRDIEVPIHKSSPLPVKQPENTNAEDF